jgi:uncharacterized membrane protein YidH (DUF202 family)
VDNIDVLWQLYKDNIEQGRHHETQRSNVASVLVAVSAGLLALITQDKQISVTDLPLTTFLVIIGFFGILFSAKQYERFSAHMDRAREYRGALESELTKRGTPTPIVQLKQQADEHSKRAHPVLSRLSLHWFWVLLYFLITCLGALLSARALSLI